jgi:hypothetical protein
MALLNRVLGRPISSAEERSQRVDALEGVTVFGLDSLGSAAYGLQAVVALLLLLGVASGRCVLPHTTAIVGLVIIVFFFYRQNKPAVESLQFACMLSGDVRVLHFAEFPDLGEQLCRELQSNLDFAAAEAAIASPKIVMGPSSFRFLTGSIIGYVARVELETPSRKVAVVIAKIIASLRLEHVVHNYCTLLLKLRLVLEGSRGVAILDTPWHLPRD